VFALPNVIPEDVPHCVCNRRRPWGNPFEDYAVTDTELPLADLTGKARIRHVALHLFATRGCAQTPLRLIAEKAGHRTIAEMMSHVDEADYDSAGLERLQGERRAEQRRASRTPTLS